MCWKSIERNAGHMCYVYQLTRWIANEIGRKFGTSRKMKFEGLSSVDLARVNNFMHAYLNLMVYINFTVGFTNQTKNSRNLKLIHDYLKYIWNVLYFTAGESVIFMVQLLKKVAFLCLWITAPICYQQYEKRRKW